jgi:hypothetical protein
MGFEFVYTDSEAPRGIHFALIKKRGKKFLIFKEIQMGSIANSFMRKGFLI